MERFAFESAARWTVGRKGVVECDQPAPPVEFSAPAEFQGELGHWTPEHLLLAAVAACYVTTFRAIADIARFETASLEVSASGTLGSGSGSLKFAEIVLRPIVGITSEGERERALRLIEKAERSCLISRSLDVPIRMKPQVELAGTETTAPPHPPFE